MTDSAEPPETPRSHPLASGFRILLAAGAFGLAVGGAILIGEGLFHIGDGIVGYLRKTAATGATGRIMKATDELLFGIVLTLFAANIAFGFCLDAAKAAHYRIPAFMSAHTIPELKATFCQVIVVYLIVDFATDVIADGGKLDVRLLYFPAAIALIALALRLLPHVEHLSPKAREPHDPS